MDLTLREFDAVSARLGDGRRFLLGDRFTAADLAFACLAAPAVLPPEYSAWLPPLDAFADDARARTDRFATRPPALSRCVFFATSGGASCADVPSSERCKPAGPNIS